MGFLDTLAGLAGGLLMHLHPTLRVMARAMDLDNQGRKTEAITILEDHLGLAPDDYEHPEMLAARLREFRGGEDIGAMFVVMLATLLSTTGRQKDGFSLFAIDAAIEDTDYSDPALLLAKLRRRGERLNPGVALQYLLCFDAALGHVNLYGEGMLLLQMDAGLDESADFEDPAILREKIAKRTSVLDGFPEFQQLYVLMLAISLSVAGRGSHAAAVLEAHLNLSGSDYENLERLRLYLHSFRSRLSPHLEFLGLLILCMHLTEIGRSSSALALMEADLGIGRSDYVDQARLSAVIADRFRTLPPEGSFAYLGIFMHCLDEQGRPEDGLALLAAWAGFGLDESQDWPEVAERLRTSLRNLNRAVAITCVNLLAVGLSASGRDRDGLALLEAYAGLDSASYSDPDFMASRLAQILEGGSEGAIGAFVGCLCAFQGESAVAKARIAVLADVYVSRLAPLGEPSRQDPMIYQAFVLYALWFHVCAPHAGERGLEVAERLLPYLRRSLSFRGVSLEDRSRFHEYAMYLRQGLLATSYRGAERETDPAKACDLWLKAQLRDAELSQRLVLECFRLEEIRLIPAGEPPVSRWPFLESSQPALEGHLPDPSASLSQGILGAGDDIPPVIPEATSGDSPLKVAYPELFQQIEEVLRHGLDEETVAIALGHRGLLVRATFGYDAELIWSALSSDGYRLAVGPRSGGRMGDLWRLRWATARHDLRMALARFEASARGVIRAMVRRDVRTGVEALLRALEEHPEAGEALAIRIEEIAKGVDPKRPVSGKLLGLTIEVLRRQPPYEDLFGAWVEVAKSSLRDCLEILEAKAPASLRTVLEEATRSYLREVAEVWPLEGLAGLLSPETDLVFQVEDALHAVPLAFLTVGDGPLYRRVRSVRSSLSLLLSLFQQEAEDDFAGGLSDEAGLLCVSHFEPEDPAWPASTWLHHGQRNLAREYGLVCRSAAETPAGAAGAIRAALADGTAYRTMTVCGHGTREMPGVVLGDGLWQGGGADLSRVGWLLLVSCSVGRLAQTGDRDVEGLCVQLALHRALSVLACRWPVASVEAVAFANEAVRQYLALLANPGTDREGLRARALNLARKALLDDESADPLLVGLNTAAAFELYGLK